MTIIKLCCQISPDDEVPGGPGGPGRDILGAPGGPGGLGGPGGPGGPGGFLCATAFRTSLGD